MKIREVFPGSTTAGANAEYVVLQMTADGQNDIDGQVLRFYGPTGNETSAFTIPTDVTNGQSQRTVLLATGEAVSEGVASAPDFNLGSGANRIDPSPTYLEITDDTANAASDFLEAFPAPRNTPLLPPRPAALLTPQSTPPRSILPARLLPLSPTAPSPTSRG